MRSLLASAAAAIALVGAGCRGGVTTIDGAVVDDASRADVVVSIDAGRADAGVWGDRFLLGGTILTPVGPLVGEVLIEGNRIACVATTCTGEPGAAGAYVIRTSGVILPGLIDAHNHGLFNVFDETDWTPLQLYHNHNQWTAEVRYGEMVDAKQYLGGEGGSPVDVRCEMAKYAEVKALIAGTTSFLLAPGTSRSCFASVVRTIDTPQNDLGSDQVQTSIAVPTNAGAQAICDNFADGSTNAYVVHVGEGVDATALNEFTTLAGRAGGCLVAPQTTIVHGTALGMPEFMTMAAAGMRLVWSPKSNLFLYGDTTRIDLATAAGVSTIALAPDWALGGSINLLDELRVADQVDASSFGDLLTPSRLFEMVTIEPARALGVDTELGSIEVGKHADLAILSGGGPADPYEALLAATPAHLELVFVDGRPLYGDEIHLVGHPGGAPCDRITICGVPKFLCIAEADPTNLLDQTFFDIVTVLDAAFADYDALVGPAGIAPFSPVAPLTVCP